MIRLDYLHAGISSSPLEISAVCIHPVKLNHKFKAQTFFAWFGLHVYLSIFCLLCLFVCYVCLFVCFI